MIHPDYRRRGLGTRLIAEIENCFPDTRYELFTSSKSLNNIRLYEKMGYEIFSEQRINEELVFIYICKKSDDILNLSAPLKK